MQQIPNTRGIVLLGLAVPKVELAASLKTAAQSDLVKAFVIAQTVFGDVAQDSSKNDVDSDAAVAEVVEHHAQLCNRRFKARSRAREMVA